MAEIFISYKREDGDFVSRLARCLESRGWTVWSDSQLNTGDVWDRVIQRELATANCILVVWSPRSLQSDPVLAEASYGRDHRKLVPIAIGKARPPVTFSHLQTTDFSSWNGNPEAPEFSVVATAIGRLCIEHKGQRGAGSEKNESSRDPTTSNKALGPANRRSLSKIGLVAAGLAVIGVSFYLGGFVRGTQPSSDAIRIEVLGELLGVAAVPNTPSHVFFIDGKGRSIDGLMFNVADRPLKLTHMAVHYANGTRQLIQVGALMAPGRTFGPVALPQHGPVQMVTFMGSSDDGNFRGQPFKPSMVEIHAARR